MDPKLTAPAKVYAGYPFIATVAVAGAPDGSVVTVGRGSGTALGGKAEVVLTLARGTHELRPTLTIGGSPVTGAATRVTARAAKNWTTTRADGAYTGKAGSRSVKFKVTKKGKELRGFSAFVAMTCPGVTAGQFTTQIGTAAFTRVKVAPDGSFVAAAQPAGIDDAAARQAQRPPRQRARRALARNLRRQHRLPRQSLRTSAPSAPRRRRTPRRRGRRS